MATEKRLIDANALLTEIEKVYADHYEQSAYQFIHDFVNAIRRRIRRASTVDAVEVVRCKDCTNYQETLGKDSGKPCGYGSCRNPCAMTGIVYDEDFCSYGERRTT